MSHPVNTEILENAFADFEALVRRRDWKRAELVIQYLEDQGFQKEPKQMLGMLVDAQSEFVKGTLPHLAGLDYEPTPDEEPPVISPAEDDVPVAIHLMTLEERAARLGVSPESLEQMELREEDRGKNL